MRLDCSWVSLVVVNKCSSDGHGSCCWGSVVWWVCKVVFMSNPTTALRLCFVVVGVVKIYCKISRCKLFGYVQNMPLQSQFIIQDMSYKFEISLLAICTAIDRWWYFWRYLKILGRVRFFWHESEGPPPMVHSTPSLCQSKYYFYNDLFWFKKIVVYLLSESKPILNLTSSQPLRYQVQLLRKI